MQTTFEDKLFVSQEHPKNRKPFRAFSHTIDRPLRVFERHLVRNRVVNHFERCMSDLCHLNKVLKSNMRNHENSFFYPKK